MVILLNLKFDLVLVVLGLVFIAARATYGFHLRPVVRWMMGRAFCVRSGHRRSTKSVTKVGDAYRSRCGRCGIRLEKQGKEGTWHVADSPRRAERLDVLEAE